jgi:hypothetical protein
MKRYGFLIAAVLMLAGVAYAGELYYNSNGDLVSGPNNLLVARTSTPMAGTVNVPSGASANFPSGKSYGGGSIEINVPLTSSSVSGPVFISDGSYILNSAKVVYGTASGSGAINLELLTGATAVGSGTSLLTGTISLASTGSTVYSGTASGSTAISAGNRVGMVISGTMTSLAQAMVTIVLKRTSAF